MFHDRDTGIVTQVFGHLLRDRPGDHVAAAAGRGGHDHLDRLLGIGGVRKAVRPECARGAVRIQARLRD